MNRIVSLFIVIILLASCKKNNESLLKSPDNNLELSVVLVDGTPQYIVKVGQKIVLDSSRLGMVMENKAWDSGLEIVKVSAITSVSESYSFTYGKRLQGNYQANEKVWTLRNHSGDLLDVRFRVSNDGIVFRYEFNDSSNNSRKVLAERTGFRFVPGTTAFIQPMSISKTGWSKVNPCYEEFYDKEVPVESPPASVAGWVYPAMFHTDDHWIVITESSLDKNYCGTHLRKEPGNEYYVDFPDSLQIFPGGDYLPQAEGQFTSPWRVIVIGNLKTVVESDLATIAAKKPTIAASFAKPGHASWSWALLKDDSTIFEVQKKFVDHAADMHWDYCLVDADWDRKIGYDKINDLVKYADSKKIGVWLWYNSAGDWNETPNTPKSKLLTSPDRQAEFAKLNSMGVKGVKIDFFGGDGRSMIQYYIDILEDAAKNNLMVNFHGSTIPRGWQRTYPNLMSMEAVKGFEAVTFDQNCADQEPSHCATLPFTRNLFDPMDFTPLSLDTVRGINRRTTPAFELALSVVFISGISHFVETPTGMKKIPNEAKVFLQDLPTTWDETRFLDGYPGKYFVVARRSGTKWYVAGINGENAEKEITLDLSFTNAESGLLITDVPDRKHLVAQSVKRDSLNKITMQPHSGFVVETK